MSYGGISMPVGGSLYGGIADSINAANSMSTTAMIALSKLLKSLANVLAEIAQDQLTKQQPIEDKLQADDAALSGASGDDLTRLEEDVNIQTQQLNTVNNNFDQAKQTESTGRDQMTQAIQQMQQEVGNIIQNLASVTQIINALRM